MHTSEEIFSESLTGIPDNFRSDLLHTFNANVRNFREGKWELAELNGGKFCEVVYSILRGHVDGVFPEKPGKPTNFLKACQELEGIDSRVFPRSIRVQIPRLLIALYEIRNNRNVGHVGGDVDPSHMDATLVLETSKWILAELIRLFHKLPTTKATALVELITERTSPLIWQKGDKKRVLNPGLSAKDKTLAVLHSCISGVSSKQLCEWVEYSNVGMFRKTVLGNLHVDKLIEFDRRHDLVELLPPGITYVEESLLPEIT